MSERRVKRTNRKPSFFWQGVLILAPMLVLAKLGALALSQDKRMAEHEAELRAQDVAEDASAAILSELTKATNGFEFRVDRDGVLLSPRPYSVTLTPQPLDFAKLSEQQRAWWIAGQTAETQAHFSGNEQWD